MNRDRRADAEEPIRPADKIQISHPTLAWESRTETIPLVQTPLPAPTHPDERDGQETFAIIDPRAGNVLRNCSPQQAAEMAVTWLGQTANDYQIRDSTHDNIVYVGAERAHLSNTSDWHVQEDNPFHAGSRPELYRQIIAEHLGKTILPESDPATAKRVDDTERAWSNPAPTSPVRDQFDAVRLHTLTVALPQALPQDDRAAAAYAFTDKLGDDRLSIHVDLRNNTFQSSNASARLIFQDRDPSTGQPVLGLDAHQHTDGQGANELHNKTEPSQAIRTQWTAHLNDVMTHAGRDGKLHAPLNDSGFYAPAAADTHQIKARPKFAHSATAGQAQDARPSLMELDQYHEDIWMAGRHRNEVVTLLAQQQADHQNPRFTPEVRHLHREESRLLAQQHENERIGFAAEDAAGGLRSIVEHFHYQMEEARAGRLVPEGWSEASAPKPDVHEEYEARWFKALDAHDTQVEKSYDAYLDAANAQNKREHLRESLDAHLSGKPIDHSAVLSTERLQRMLERYSEIREMGDYTPTEHDQQRLARMQLIDQRVTAEMQTNHAKDLLQAHVHGDMKPILPLHAEDKKLLAHEQLASRVRHEAGLIAEHARDMYPRLAASQTKEVERVQLTIDTLQRQRHNLRKVIDRTIREIPSHVRDANDRSSKAQEYAKSGTGLSDADKLNLPANKTTAATRTKPTSPNAADKQAAPASKAKRKMSTGDYVMQQTSGRGGGRGR